MKGVKENTGLGKTTSASFGSPDGVCARQLPELGCKITVPPKATIFIQDERKVAVYRLTQGVAAIFKKNGHGKRIVGFALPGDFLNSPFADRHSCSVDAISEVAADQFPTEAFLGLPQANPASLNQMLEISSHELEVLLGRAMAEERLVEFVAGWRARIGRKGALANLVPLPMSRTDVADCLGLTIETVSRVLGKLEREKVLRVIPGRLQLIGPAERPLIFEKKLHAVRLAIGQS
jgi:CRP/FNR family transcriptional regulator